MDIDRLGNLLGALGVGLADGQANVAAAATGLAGPDGAALNAVGQQPGISIDGLRTVLALTHPGAVRVTDRLVARGLVERGPGVDGRTRGLRVTADGAAAWERLTAARREWLTALVGRLDGSAAAALEPVTEALLAALTTSFEESEHLCRLCDERVCPQDVCPVTVTVVT